MICGLTHEIYCFISALLMCVGIGILFHGLYEGACELLCGISGFRGSVDDVTVDRDATIVKSRRERYSTVPWP